MSTTAGHPRTPRRSHEPRHAPRVPFAVLVVGLIVGGMALLLALNTASAANELRRHDLAAQDSSVAAQVQVLRNEVAASAAPGALARAAAQLGMVPANKPAFLVIGPDGTVRVMGHPGAANAAPLVAASPKKKPKPTKSPTATTSRSATAGAKSTGARSTATKPANAKSTGKSSKTPKPAATAKSSPRPTPKPTPTPTPTVTLPGGDR